MKNRAALVLLGYFAVACGGDGSGASASSGSTGDGTGSTTQNVPPGPTTTDDVTGTDLGSDGASGGSGGSGGGSATGTGEPTSTTSDEGSSGGASTGASDGATESSGTSDELPPYGNCQGQTLPCPEGTFCLLVPGSGLCTPEGCGDASDCPDPPPGGDAPVTCLDANGDDIDDCRIDCSQGETCPTGMECFSDEICVWT